MPVVANNLQRCKLIMKLCFPFNLGRGEVLLAKQLPRPAQPVNILRELRSAGEIMKRKISERKASRKEVSTHRRGGRLYTSVRNSHWRKAGACKQIYARYIKNRLLFHVLLYGRVFADSAETLQHLSPTYYTCAFNRTSRRVYCAGTGTAGRYFSVSAASRSELYQRQASFAFSIPLSLSLCRSPSSSLLRERSDYSYATNACLTALAKLRYVLFNTCNAGESDPKHTVVSGGTD